VKFTIFRLFPQTFNYLFLREFPNIRENHLRLIIRYQRLILFHFFQSNPVPVDRLMALIAPLVVLDIQGQSPSDLPDLLAAQAILILLAAQKNLEMG
jgi:hypothetical protein